MVLGAASHQGWFVPKTVREDVSVLISLILMVYWQSLAFLGLQTQLCGLHLLVQVVVSCVHLFIWHSLYKGTSHFGSVTYSTPV